MEREVSTAELAPALATGRREFLAADSLVIYSQPVGASAEAVRALRTHVMAQHVQEGRRALAICAAASHTGSTFVAANLAVSMSQIGVKTLLIDGNLRDPGVDKVIHPGEKVDGLAQYLASEDAQMSDCIQAEVLPNLAVMYSGGRPKNPQELLSSDRFESLINVCLRDYEFTIVDTPPANSCSDARRISTLLGYSLVVARQNDTRIDDLRTLIGQLEGDHARVIGTVLNEF